MNLKLFYGGENVLIGDLHSHEELEQTHQE